MNRQDINEKMLCEREPILRRQEFLSRGTPDCMQLDVAIGKALTKLKRNIAYYGEGYPAPSSDGGIYPTIDNVEWTSGFWSGMLWLAYQYSGEAIFCDTALNQVRSFERRIDNRIATDTHDLGFLYSLSCVSAYKITGDLRAKEAAINAGKLLLDRFLPCAGIIQAWGDLNDPAQAGRMIIDCNLNLPLLHWTGKVTGDARFADAADRHIGQAATYLVRADASTFHTYFMEPKTGLPLCGKTHQGYSDTSCWSRGQAWGILGFPLNYRYNGNGALIATAARITNYFLNRLPEDLVCAWDLFFTDPTTPRDSSAAAIAVCGLLELTKHLPLSDPDRHTYAAAAIAILQSLIENYTDTPDAPGAGLLAHGVYHMPNKIGVDECCIWGDYFYLEALMRLAFAQEQYW